MKNRTLILAMVGLLFLACSKGKEGGKTDTSENGLIFELSLVNQPVNGMVTKTRPLFSSEAIQEVERVGVYAFKKSGTDFLFYKQYPMTWAKGTSFKRYAILDTDKLVAGDYKILAVGQEITDNYTLTSPIVDITKIEDMTAEISASGKETELFAGNNAVTVTSEGVRISLEMNRKVAGVLAYFKNVPATLGGETVKFLRLSVTNTDKKVFLLTGAPTAPVNASYDIFNIDISTQTVTPEGVYAGNDLAAQGVVKVNNSQLYGSFLLPVGNITMTLGLYGATNNVLKTWTIQDNNNITFNVMANHFYSLGQKINKGNTTGGGTPDTGDDDAPIDLLKDQTIVITINAAWDLIHDLVLQ